MILVSGRSLDRSKVGPHREPPNDQLARLREERDILEGEVLVLEQRRTRLEEDILDLEEHLQQVRTEKVWMRDQITLLTKRNQELQEALGHLIDEQQTSAPKGEP